MQLWLCYKRIRRCRNKYNHFSFQRYKLEKHHAPVIEGSAVVAICNYFLFYFYQCWILTVETFRKWWTTALPSMTGTWCFPSFYRWKIKLLYLFLHLLIQIWSKNHNCIYLNVFYRSYSYNIARLVKDQWMVIVFVDCSLNRVC